MNRDSEGNYVLWSGTGPRGLGLVILAVFLSLAGYWGYDWASQCYGKEGKLQYKDSWTPFFGGSGHIRPFDFLHGHTFGLLWVRQGQTVAVEYKADFKSRGNWADIWYGTLEDWAVNKFGYSGFHKSKSYQNISNGSGRFMFVAQKTGFHVLYYFSGAVNGEFTVSWRAF